jgi:CPA1 family monovalent cation:H+ antiporter
LRLELALFRELLEEGLIGRELYDALEREHMTESRRVGENRPLDLGLRTEELVPRFDLFSALAPPELKALAHLVHPRLALPEEKIIQKDERGAHVFFISSGAVEVVLPGQKVRLGRGDFFGEMALLSGRPRSADVVALGFCQLLVLSAADFRRFLTAHPNARDEIDRIVAQRTLMNEEFTRTLSASAI